MPISATEYRALIDLQRDLVYAGVHPSYAGELVRRAWARCEARDVGMGRIKSYPVAGRPTVPGERCTLIRETPGEEGAMWARVNQMRQQGFNVMEIEPGGSFPAVQTFWACPSGTLPMESQRRVFQSQQYGGPMYAGEQF